MTASPSPKTAARQLARDNVRRAAHARHQRDRDTIDDVAQFLVAVARIDELRAWKKQRVAVLLAQADAEFAARLTQQQTDAASAVRRMRERGETLASITALTGTTLAAVRAHSRTTNPQPLTAPADALGGARGDGGNEAGGGGDLDPPTPPDPGPDAAQAADSDTSAR